MEDILLVLNEWWREKTVREDLAKPYKRKFFKEIIENIGYRQIQVLTGLRRVGKSTLLFQTIQYLISKGVNPKNILYFSFDIEKTDLLNLLKTYSIITKTNWKREKTFLILDEIQKLPSWPSKLKVIYDNFPNVKILVSGSASLLLEKEASANLAGRYFTHKITPLTIIEHYELKTGKKIEDPEIWKPELESHLKEYLETPFPEIIGWSPFKTREYIRELIIEKVIRSDIPSTTKVNPEKIEILLNILYGEPGQQLNLDPLSRDLKASKKTLVKYLWHLKYSYLTREVMNYKPSIKSISTLLHGCAYNCGLSSTN